MDITIPDLSRDADRGQVGIETLIIFIAMILVAAIAASVLINTAGYLQNQASATSEDSEAQVSNQVLVISSIGEIEDPDTVDLTIQETSTADNYELVISNASQTSNLPTGDLSSSEFTIGSWTDNTLDLGSVSSGTASLDITPTNTEDQLTLQIDTADSEPTDSGKVSVSDSFSNRIGQINMTVMQSPGANEIDLGGASVEYIGPDGEATLGYSESIEVGSFAVEGTTDPENTAPVLTERQDRFTITADLANDETADLRNLKEGEEATIRIVTQSGSQAVTVVNVPQSLSSYSDADAVEL